MKKFMLLLAGLLIVSCGKNDDDITPGGPDPDPTANVYIHDFMWSALNLWYYWQPNAPDLGDNRFSNSTEYTEYLLSYDTPEEFFYNTCYMHTEIVGSANAVDRFSFLNDDYKELTNSLAGISRSNGLEFGLQLYDTDKVLGYVQYIIPDSDASVKDISRGEIFIGVNGTTLTLQNYQALLFGDDASYTLNMADVSGSSLVLNGKEVTLVKEEGLVENPVYITETYEIGGHIIGYLMYNGFTNEFDEDLNDAFGTFSAAGVTDLVLDLRYNLGGSVNSSRLLSSMIYGTNTNDVFLEQQWNPFIQSAFTSDDPDALKDYFANTTSEGTALNTLNLDQVYVLMSGNTASASELVINGLNPYIDVVKIGTTTRGKREFSLTMVDDPDRSGAPFIYSPTREANINPDNSYAIQPIVGVNANAVGFNDYADGFIPDIELREDLENMGVLGDVNEPLLARAIQAITGTSAKQSFEVHSPAEGFTSSKFFKPLKDNMVLDKDIKIDLNLE